MTIVIVVVILVFLILAHEFGHFVAAKVFGVRVEEFGVGFPPRAFLFGTWGGTDYTLNWIPFGGFVRLYGEEEDEGEHGKGSMVDAPRWKQALILAAGVAMNVVAAWILFVCALSIGVPQVVAQPLPGQNVQLYVSDVISGSPAEAAGLVEGDQILSVVDQNGESPAALTPEQLVAFVSSHGGVPLSIVYLYNGATGTASVIPANGVNAQNAGEPAIGVGLVTVATEPLPVAEAVEQSFSISGNAFALVWQGLWGILSSAAHGAPDLSGVVGPVGLVSVVGEAAKSGVGEVIELAAFISINLAIVNLIPIPALDGGRLVVLAVEAIMRRPAPKLAVALLNTIGVALIILLMVTVTYHDIVRLLA